MDLSGVKRARASRAEERAEREQRRLGETGRVEGGRFPKPPVL